jgi:hypothetical protein
MCLILSGCSSISVPRFAARTSILPRTDSTVTSRNLKDLNITSPAQASTDTSPNSGVSIFKKQKLNSFVPIDPLAVHDYHTFRVKPDGVAKPETKNWPKPDETKAINDLLPNHTASVSTFQMQGDVGLTYIPASIGISKGKYQVVMDYMKYRDEMIYESNSSDPVGRARVGVGIRLVADLSTFKTDLNLGSLIAIGLNAKLGYLKGSLSVNVIGIDSPEVTDLIPLTSIIDETSIQAALQSLAAVKSKLHQDGGLRLTPHVVALQLDTPGASDKEAACCSK